MLNIPSKAPKCLKTVSKEIYFSFSLAYSEFSSESSESSLMNYGVYAFLECIRRGALIISSGSSI